MSVVTVTVLSDGQAVGDGHALLSLDVRHELNRLPSATLLYADGDAAQRRFPLSDSALFDPGKSIEIKARYEGTPSSEATLFKGPVVRHALEADAHGSVLRVDLRHPAIRLTRPRRSRVVRDSTDSALMQRLIADAGLSANVQATELQHEAVVQFDCSDWDLLLSRAEANGQVVWCDSASAQVRVASPRPAGAPALTLDYGLSELYELEFACDASGQSTGFKGRSWDARQQAARIEAGAPPPAPSQGRLRSAQAADALGFGESELLHGVDTLAEELKAWAGGQALRGALSLVRGRAAIPGNGSVALLQTATIRGVAERFAGNALVSGLCHRIDGNGWVTELQFGLSPQPFHERPAIAAPPAAGLLPPAAGLQVGVVRQVDEDPRGEYRVLVDVPALGDASNGLWARWAGPDAGKDRGWYFRPEPGDEVVLGFFNQDPRQPVVLGALFGSKNRPPAAVVDSSAKNNLRGLVSRSGLTVGLVDGDEKPRLYLKTPGGQQLTLDDEQQSISLKDQHGNTLTLDRDGITLHSAKDLLLSASGNVEIEASGNASLKGSQVDLK